MRDLENIRLRFEKVGPSFWVAAVPSRWRVEEFLAHGTDEAPNEDELVLLGDFLEIALERVVALRSQLRFGFLYRPIRVAINNEKRIGVRSRADSP